MGHQRTTRPDARKPASSSWWERWPEIYNQELRAFEAHGVEYTVAFKKYGFLILELIWPVNGKEPIRLNLGFSPFHPFMRPAISAPDSEFERHQNPFSKELCLLVQGSYQWDDKPQLVADFIEERLGHLQKTLAARKEGAASEAAILEERAPDPLTSYFAASSAPNSVILFDGRNPLPSAEYGFLRLLCVRRPPDAFNDFPFEGVVQRIAAVDGRVIVPDFNLPVSKNAKVVNACWVKVKRPLSTDDASALLADAQQTIKKHALLQPLVLDRFQQIWSSSEHITAIVFPEEVEYGVEGAGWLFIWTRKVQGGAGRSSVASSLVRGERAGESDVFARLPAATALRNKKVVLLGCGAIGSYIAVELARAGVGSLQLVDYDVLQPGNSLRWPLGREYWGYQKGHALALFIERNYPHTSVKYREWHLGGAITRAPSLTHADSKRACSHVVALRDLVEAADLVIDATAFSEVQSAVSDMCRQVKKNLIIAYATEGLVGGLVARLRAEENLCWNCIRHHWNEGVLPEPPHDPTGVVTPVGCNSPTFSGGGYDLQEVSLEAVRSAVGMLGSGVCDAGDWSLALLAMRSGDGRRVPPRWTVYDVKNSPKCSCGDKR